MVEADFFRGRRALVTGHTGFKGAWLAYWLKLLGAEVTGFALAPATSPNLFDALALGGRIDSRIGDLREPAAVRAAVQAARPEIVFHLAAQALVGAGYDDPLATFDVNVAGTAALLDACRAEPSVKAIVVVTSDKCYEPRADGRPLREDDPLGGHDPYSASKACTELVAASFRRSFFAAKGVGLATARAGNVIGGGDFTRGRLIPDCLEAFAAKRPVVLRHPDAVRPWQHVLEPLTGYLVLAQRLVAAPQEAARAWNFGPDDADAIPVRALVERVAKGLGVASAWERAPGEPPHETALLRLDASLARAQLGWRPAFHLAAALDATIEWHRAFARGAGAEEIAELMRGQIAAHRNARGVAR